MVPVQVADRERLVDLGLGPHGKLAVGDYDYTTGELPFADVWNGRQWRLLKMPAGP